MSEESRAAKERVLAVYPNAKAAKFNLGMDSVSCEIVSLHGEASGFFMEDVEAKAWIDAAARLQPAAPEPKVTPVDQFDRITEAINWACGCGSEEFSPPEGATRYWWRSELTRRAGLVYDGTRYILAQPTLRDDKETKHA